MKKILLVFVLIFSAGEVFPYISKYIVFDTNSREYQMVLNPDIFTIKEDILIAEGIKGKELEADLAKISNFESGLTADEPLPDNPIEASRIIFENMHKKLMIKYSETDPSLDNLIRKGFYNHYSAILLFNSLIEDQGFPTKIDENSSNMLSLIDIDGIDIYSDAADPAGYDLSMLPERRPVQSLRPGKRGTIGFIYSSLCQASYAKGQYYTAYQYALKALAADPDQNIENSNLQPVISGFALYLADTKKDYAEALSVLEEAVLHFQEKGRYLGTYFNIADKYIDYLCEASQYEKAIAEMSRYLRLAGENEEYKNNFYTRIMNRVINHDGNFQEGYEIGKIALAQMPKNDNIRILVISGFKQLSRRLADEWRKYPAGEELMHNWYQLMKNDYFDTILEDYYSSVGMKFFENGNTEKGLEILKSGLASFPQSKVLADNVAFINGSIALSYYRRGDIDSGIRYARIGLSEDPDNEYIMNILVNITGSAAKIFFRKGDFDNGIRYAREGLSEDPANESLQTILVNISYYAANYFFRRGDFESGIRYAKEGLSVEPANSALNNVIQSGYQKYAKINWFKRDYAKALSISEEGLKLFPSDEILKYYRDNSLKALK